jgi:hypothetical protein
MRDARRSTPQDGARDGYTHKDSSGILCQPRTDCGKALRCCFERKFRESCLGSLEPQWNRLEDGVHLKSPVSRISGRWKLHTPQNETRMWPMLYAQAYQTVMIGICPLHVPLFNKWHTSTAPNIRAKRASPSRGCDHKTGSGSRRKAGRDPIRECILKLKALAWSVVRNRSWHVRLQQQPLNRTYP